MNINSGAMQSIIIFISIIYIKTILFRQSEENEITILTDQTY